MDDGMAKGKATPVEANSLVKDKDGPEASGTFSYSSFVRMMLYLIGHSSPDIAYAMNFCALYMLCPKYSHELASERID